MVSREDFAVERSPTWCPGCGNYGILTALKKALTDNDIAPHEIFIVTGIGQSSKLPHYLKVNGFHTLHGRPVPIATGARLANHGLRVMVAHGDGDGYAEGMSHFIHVARRNVDILDMVHDNRIYGLTRGQYSPTSEKGKHTPTSPEGAIERPVNPLTLALVSGATFVARGYSGDPKHLAWLIGEGLAHKGYALLDVLQPCVIFNRPRSYDFYNERVYKLEDEEYGADDLDAALKKAREWGDRIPIGILYRSESLPTYEEQVPALKAGPLVERPLETLTAEQVEALRAELA